MRYNAAPGYAAVNSDGAEGDFTKLNFGEFVAGVTGGAGTAEGSEANRNFSNEEVAAEERPTAPFAMPKVVPNKEETPDSAFAKLDSNNKGYLTPEDISPLSGFDVPFQAADVTHNGKLTREEFDAAWSLYTGRRKGE